MMTLKADDLKIEVEHCRDGLFDCIELILNDDDGLAYHSGGATLWNAFKWLLKDHYGI